MSTKAVMEEPKRTRPKQKLWFDPKNPPKTPVYVGQRIPIYIVPDDTEEDDRLVEPSWVKTDFVFRVVGIRRVEVEDDDGCKTEGDVVDVEWPNKHIDTDIPISNMYGHFARIPKSLVSHFTEEYNSDDEDVEIIDLSKAKTNQEKLEQLLKMLQFLSEQRERIRQEGGFDDLDASTVTVEETVEDITVLDEDMDADSGNIIIKEDTIEDTGSILDPVRLQKLLPDLSPAAIQALRAAAQKSDLPTEPTEPEEPDKPQPRTKTAKKTSKKAKKARAKRSAAKKAASTEKKTSIAKKAASTEKKTASTEKVTKEMITKWFQQPAKGGLRITELRNKAREMGIQVPQSLKRPELQKEMQKVVAKGPFYY
jgi:hypothetical protein